MAGMMAGYVDIPVTCLTKMKSDVELLEARVDMLLRLAGRADGLISQDDFAVHYVEFFDSAPRVLGDGTDGSTKEAAECAVQ
mmetsp:Transcript_38027/g.102991  ORF Transcript_38027/g.102991 Transcript_38027/m.102991 type:complete len:82 (+) Transcript_38027:24-269(+)